MDTQPVGIFYAASLVELAEQVDEFLPPQMCEFKTLETGAIMSWDCAINCRQLPDWAMGEPGGPLFESEKDPKESAEAHNAAFEARHNQITRELGFCGEVSELILGYERVGGWTQFKAAAKNNPALSEILASCNDYGWSF